MLLPKIKKNPKNTNGRLAIPAPAGLLVFSLCSTAQSKLFVVSRIQPQNFCNQPNFGRIF